MVASGCSDCAHEHSAETASKVATIVLPARCIGLSSCYSPRMQGVAIDVANTPNPEGPALEAVVVEDASPNSPACLGTPGSCLSVPSRSGRAPFAGQAYP